MKTVHHWTGSVLFACGALWLGAQPVAAVPVATGVCNTNQTKFVVSETNQSTTSNVFVRVSDTSINFSSSVAGCVKVTFSAHAFADGGMQVRALIDGGGYCRPASVVFHSGPDASTHAITFICKNVPAGGHILRVEFLSTSGTATMGFRTTEVSFR